MDLDGFGWMQVQSDQIRLESCRSPISRFLMETEGVDSIFYKILLDVSDILYILVWAWPSD